MRNDGAPGAPGVAMNSLEIRLERLDARGKPGIPCGESFINANDKCHKGKGATGMPPKLAAIVKQAQARRREIEALNASRRKTLEAGAQGLEITSASEDFPEESKAPKVQGRLPVKALGSGNFGDTYLFKTKDGTKVVVKVDRLSNQDPKEDGFDVPQKTQRLNAVTREHAAMHRASELGLGPKPLSNVQKLPDGRLAFAYEFVDGMRLWKDHRSAEPTPEALDLLEQPGFKAKIAASVGKIARIMAESGFEHGDGHGGNILLKQDGTISLIDWGYSSQSKVGSAAEKAQIEARQAWIMGDMFGINGSINMRARNGLGEVKGPISGETGSTPLNVFQVKISKALTAEQQVIKDYESAWKKDPKNILSIDKENQLLDEAIRLNREKGVNFKEAQRIVGIEPLLTPEILSRAAAARDAIFGERQLRTMRRMIDTHYQAWNDYQP
jgi:predicted Ser/Thr protein kinase